MNKTILSLVFLIGFAYCGYSQLETPQASPESTINQKVGLTDFSVNYSRPSKKDRVIFGDLVPYDVLWRTGANGSTDITFSDDISFGGKDVPAGTYALYTEPGKMQWGVVLYKETDHWGTPKQFDDSQVAAKVSVTPQTTSQKVETFTIGFNNLTNNGADLVLCWDNTKVNVPIEVPTVEMVQKNIDKALNGPTGRDYFVAARFYYEENMDMNQAYEWIKKATSMEPKAFYMFKLQSEIEANLGDKFQAIQTAKKSMELAEQAGNMQYVKMNKANIAKWSKR